MPTKPEWTILTYIAAQNDLFLPGKRSRGEILAVGSSPEVRHGVLFDGQSGTARYVIGAAGTVDAQEKLENFDSGDPGALVETASWLFEQYPAERYGIVLWSHGTGWAPTEQDPGVLPDEPVAATRAARGMRRRTTAGARKEKPNATPKDAEWRPRGPRDLGFLRPAPPARQRGATTRDATGRPTRRRRAIAIDDGTGHSLDTLELARVVKLIRDRIGAPLALLGMDACLMGNVEVAWQLRDDVQAMVASSELVPGNSWPYPAIYGALRDVPDMTGGELAGLIVDRFLDFYTTNPPAAGDVTKVALDLAKLPPLGSALTVLATALRDAMPSGRAPLEAAQRLTRERETRAGARVNCKFRYDLWDLGTIAAAIAGADLPAPVREAAAGVRSALASGAGPVIRAGHIGDWFDGTSGLSVYLPPPGAAPLGAPYRALDFARATEWDAFLDAYRDG